MAHGLKVLNDVAPGHILWQTTNPDLALCLDPVELIHEPVFGLLLALARAALAEGLPALAEGLDDIPATKTFRRTSSWNENPLASTLATLATLPALSKLTTWPHGLSGTVTWPTCSKGRPHDKPRLEA